MIKRSLTLALIPAAFYLNAQDITLIKNTAEVYSSSINTGSTKYNAMAGAMGALGGDVSTLNTNPAGLGVFITSDVNLTLNIDNNKNQSTIAGGQKDYSTSNTNFGQVGGVLSFPIDNSDWKFVNIGLNYSHQNLENYIETPANGVVISDNNGTTISNLGHAYDRTGDLSKLNIGVGANYDNNFYVGASLNFSKSELTQYDSQRFLLSSDNKVYDLNANYSPYSEDASGFSLSAGVIARVINEVRLGASIESPTWWSMDRVFVSNTMDSQNNIYAREYTEDRRLTTPMKMTLSGAFVPNKNLAINIDYTLGLTKPKYKVQGEAESMLNEFFNKNYKNVSEVKVGAEYRIKALRLRGGYAFASNPFENNALIGERQTIALGVGYNFKSFYLDLAYQNITADYTNYYGDGDYFGNSLYLQSNEVSSNIKNNRNTFFLTAGWKF